GKASRPMMTSYVGLFKGSPGSGPRIYALPFWVANGGPGRSNPFGSNSEHIKAGWTLTTVAITVDDIVLATIGALIGLVVTLPVTYLVVDRIVERRGEERIETIKKKGEKKIPAKIGVGCLSTLFIHLSLF